MTTRRAVWEVARRELVERSRSRTTRISVVLLLILSIGSAVAAARLSGATPTDKIGLVGARSVTLEPAIRLQAHAAGRRVRFHRFASPAAGTRGVREGQVTVLLVDAQRIIVKSAPAQAAVRVVRDAVAARTIADRLRQSGLSEAQAIALLAPHPLPIDVLEPQARNLDRNRGMLAVGLMALLLVLVFYGQAVAQGVTEEKASRVVELLLTTLSPRRLLTGKVLGIGILGLAQLLLAGGAALAAGQLAGGAGLPGAAPETVALVVLWFVLGYVFYSVAFAATGALVSRQEDLQTAMAPINLTLIAGFYVALIVANSNPNGTVARIAAFVPPFAPMVVPARMVLGDMTALGLIAAVIVDLLATAALMMLAARIYERAILRIGAPLKLRRLLAHRRSGHREPSDGRDRTGSDHARLLNSALRVAAIGLLISGAAIGLSEPLAVVLIVLGTFLVLLLRRRSGHGPRHA